MIVTLITATQRRFGVLWKVPNITILICLTMVQSSSTDKAKPSTQEKKLLFSFVRDTLISIAETAAAA